MSASWKLDHVGDFIAEILLMKKLIVFDLNGTLAQSKTTLDLEMATLLRDPLGIIKVAVISGGNWP
jgi:phosphomannomutase